MDLDEDFADEGASYGQEEFLSFLTELFGNSKTSLLKNAHSKTMIIDMVKEVFKTANAHEDYATEDLLNFNEFMQFASEQTRYPMLKLLATLACLSGGSPTRVLVSDANKKFFMSDFLDFVAELTNGAVPEATARHIFHKLTMDRDVVTEKDLKGVTQTGVRLDLHDDDFQEVDIRIAFSTARTLVFDELLAYVWNNSNEKGETSSGDKTFEQFLDFLVLLGVVDENYDERILRDDWKRAVSDSGLDRASSVSFKQFHDAIHDRSVQRVFPRIAMLHDLVSLAKYSFSNQVHEHYGATTLREFNLGECLLHLKLDIVPEEVFNILAPSRAQCHALDKSTCEENDGCRCSPDAESCSSCIAVVVWGKINVVKIYEALRIYNYADEHSDDVEIISKRKTTKSAVRGRNVDEDDEYSREDDEFSDEDDEFSEKYVTGVVVKEIRTRRDFKVRTKEQLEKFYHERKEFVRENMHLIQGYVETFREQQLQLMQVHADVVKYFDFMKKFVDYIYDFVPRQYNDCTNLAKWSLKSMQQWKNGAELDDVESVHGEFDARGGNALSRLMTPTQDDIKRLSTLQVEMDQLDSSNDEVSKDLDALEASSLETFDSSTLQKDVNSSLGDRDVSVASSLLELGITSKSKTEQNSALGKNDDEIFESFAVTDDDIEYDVKRVPSLEEVAGRPYKRVRKKEIEAPIAIETTSHPLPRKLEDRVRKLYQHEFFRRDLWGYYESQYEDDEALHDLDRRDPVARKFGGGDRDRMTRRKRDGRDYDFRSRDRYGRRKQ